MWAGRQRPCTFKAQVPLGLAGRGVRAAPNPDSAPECPQLCCRFCPVSAFRRRQCHGGSSRNRPQAACVHLAVGVQTVSRKVGDGLVNCPRPQEPWRRALFGLAVATAVQTRPARLCGGHSALKGGRGGETWCRLPGSVAEVGSGLVSECEAGSSPSGLFFGTRTVAGLGADVARMRFK